MTSISSSDPLKALQNYGLIFEAAQKQEQAIPEMPQIGGAIPRIGDTLLYVHSLTPLQKKKIVSVSLLVIAILAAATLITTSLLFKNDQIMWGLLPIGVLGSAPGVFAPHYFQKMDFDSPKVRAKEEELLRTHQLSLSQINHRYPNFGIIVSYGLMGSVSREIYKETARLCQNQAHLDDLYRTHRNNLESSKIESIYKERLDLLNEAYRLTSEVNASRFRQLHAKKVSNDPTPKLNANRLRRKLYAKNPSIRL